MWVRLLTVKDVSIAGSSKKYHPGDWVEVGKHDALTWLAAGEATLPDGDMAPLVGDCGIMVYGGTEAPKLAGKMPITVGDLFLPYPQSLLLRSGACVRENYIPVGFFLVNHWDLAVPLADYEAMAITRGTEKERQRTLNIIKDLRVPVYNADTVFIRRTKETGEFLNVWKEELTDSTEMDLAFLRAVYIAKPLICALPVQWLKRGK